MNTGTRNRRRIRSQRLIILLLIAVSALSMFPVTTIATNSPSLMLTPNFGVPGTTVNVIATGFNPSDIACTISFSTSVGSSTGCLRYPTDSNPNASFTVSNIAPIGPIIVTVNGTSDYATAIFTVGALITQTSTTITRTTSTTLISNTTTTAISTMPLTTSTTSTSTTITSETSTSNYYPTTLTYTTASSTYTYTVLSYYTVTQQQTTTNTEFTHSTVTQPTTITQPQTVRTTSTSFNVITTPANTTQTVTSETVLVTTVGTVSTTQTSTIPATVFNGLITQEDLFFGVVAIIVAYFVLKHLSRKTGSSQNKERTIKEDKMSIGEKLRRHFKKKGKTPPKEPKLVGQSQVSSEQRTRIDDVFNKSFLGDTGVFHDVEK